MGRGICPNCYQVYAFDDHCGDVEHNCQDMQPVSALTQDDLVVYGTWVDFTGSGTEPTNNFRASENKLQGTKSELYGGNVGDYTQRGNRVSIVRSRDHIENIEIPSSNQK